MKVQSGMVVALHQLPEGIGGVNKVTGVLSASSRIERRCQDMAYVIAEPCINVKDTACVDACPVIVSILARTKMTLRPQRNCTWIRLSVSTAEPASLFAQRR